MASCWHDMSYVSFQVLQNLIYNDIRPEKKKACIMKLHVRSSKSTCIYLLQAPSFSHQATQGFTSMKMGDRETKKTGQDSQTDCMTWHKCDCHEITWAVLHDNRALGTDGQLNGSSWKCLPGVKPSPKSSL